MPFILSDDTTPQARLPSAVPPTNPVRPMASEIIGAAFSHDNPTVNLVQRLRQEDFPRVEGHNPLDTIRGTVYEELHKDSFIESGSPAEDRSIMRRIDEEDAHRKTLDAAGFGGTVASIFAGTLDPTIALPAGTIYRTARGGYALGRTALSTGAAAASQAAIQETVLQANQETRSLGESTAAIASAAILGGLIGTGASALLSRAERETLVSSVDRLRAETDAHVNQGAALELRSGASPASQRWLDLLGEAGADREKFEQALAEMRGDKQTRVADMMDVAEAYGYGGTPLKKTKDGIIDHIFGNWLAERRFETSRAIETPQPPIEKSFDSLGGTFETRLTPRFQAEAERVFPVLRSELDRVGLSQVGLNLANDMRLRTGSASYGADGGYIANIIHVSLAGGRGTSDLLDTLHHETLHALYRLGLFTDQEWQVLANASNEKWRKQFDVDRKYAAWAEGSRIEEGAAQAYGKWVAGLLSGASPQEITLLQRLQKFFEAVRNALRGAGFQTADDIFERIQSGEIGARSGRLSEPGEARLSIAGAAASDTRELELESSGLGKTARLSPTRRVLSAVSTAARRVMADLAEVPYRFVGNVEGEATTQGPSLDRIARMEINGARVEVSDGLDRLYGEYRFGDGATRAPNFRDRFERVIGRETELMTYTEFKQEVSRALIEGDTHSIPQVEQAAQLIRKRVFEPWKERAIKAGLLPEDVDTKTAESYFQRIYNKEAINANRPAFVNKVVSYLADDQRTKAAAQERLRALNDELHHARDRIAKSKSEEDTLLATTHHDEVRAKIEAELGAWEGKSSTEAKAAIKAREKYARDSGIKFGEKHGVGAGRPDSADRLKAADEAVDRAVARILESDRNLGIDDLRGRAHAITDNILGSPDGRLPYDIDMGGPEIGWTPKGGEPPRGPLARREFNIPDAAIRDFLEQDAEKVVATHLRTIVPDVLLTERFGDTRMTEAFKRIQEDYAARIDATKNAKEAKRLGDERDAVIRDIAAVRDRIRGVYGWSADLRNMARVANGAKAINNLTSMGSAAISSLSDFAGASIRYGFGSTFADGWRPFLSHLTGNNEAFGQFKSQMRALGIGVETAINARQHSLDDVADLYRPQSRVERGLQWANDKFFIANMLAPLTDMQKTIAAHVSVSEILRATKAVAEGRATKKQIGNLAESGIDAHMANRIWEQFQTGGEVKDGVHLPNTADWKARDAAEALNGAVARDVDIMVVTPGQEKPLWMSHPVFSLFGQFKAFTASATERILVANLQRRDAAVLQGLIASIGLGMLSYKANSMFGGQKTSDRPQDWIKEGISRGGVLGWFEEGNALASKMTRGGVDIYRMIGADKPLSRFASRSTLDMFLGPTAAKIQGLAKVTGAAAARDWTESDTTALRRLTAGQNLFWLRGVLNQVEEGANHRFGIEMKDKP